MKYLKKFANHTLYEAYLVGSEFTELVGKPTVQFCKLENEVHYNKIMPSYNLLDILYADANGNKKVDSTVLDPSLGYTPIGLCVTATGFFGENEPARWMSLKYMSYDTPETGSLKLMHGTPDGIFWGNEGTDISTIANITTTHQGGHGGGNLTADWITTTSDKIPALFTENNEWNISELGTVNAYAVTDIDGKNKTDKILATVTKQLTWQTDTIIENESEDGYAPAACCCARYHTLGTQAGDWYLGACGEISMIIVQRPQINAKLAQIAEQYPDYCISLLENNHYWTSTEIGYDGEDEVAYSIYTDDSHGYGYLRTAIKSEGQNVIAMLAF